MALGKMRIEGTAEFGINELICVCGHCNNHDLECATIEFNFKQQAVYYSCSKCGKMNEINFSKPHIPPMPKSRMK